MLALIPPVRVLADVGCDHALLACRAVEGGRAEQAVAIDRSDRALEGARRNVEQLGLQARIELVWGDGFRALSSRRIDAAALAGLGGRTIVELCRALDPRDLGARWLVVQPNRDVAQVRTALGELGWGLDAESLPGGAKRSFPTIRFDAERAPRPLTHLEAEVGPLLLRTRPPTLPGYLDRLRAHWARCGPADRDPGLLAALDELRTRL